MLDINNIDNLFFSIESKYDIKHKLVISISFSQHALITFILIQSKNKFVEECTSIRINNSELSYKILILI